MFKNNKNQKKFLSVLILCTLIFSLTFHMIPGIIRKDLSNNLRTSAEYDAAGIIALWSGPLNTIPAGWKLCDGSDDTINTTNLFVYSTNGTESSGSTGGSTSHNHSYSTVPLHDHGVTSITSTPHSHSYPVPQYYRAVGQPGALITFTALSLGTQNTGSTNPSHSHTMNSAGGTPPFNMSEEENFIPPYYEMAFIEKETNAPVIPIGLITMWTGTINTIPAGWELCNGSNGTPDLREKFIRGAPPGQNPGTLGGNVSHNHTYTQIPSHSHSIGSNIGGSHSHGNTYGVDSTIGWDLLGLRPVFTPTTGYTSYTNVPHTHTVPQVGQVNCTSQNTTNLPPYYSVAFLMNTVVAEALPVGVISMWGDSIANLPPGWNQCDGTNGTPDMLDIFPRGIATGEQPGIVGGTATHRHIYTEVPQHTHTVNSDNMNHRHSFRTASGTTNGGLSADTSCSSSWGTPINDNTASSSPSHNHDILPTGSSTSYTSYANSLPPYIKVIYMQKGLSLSNPSPQDGATDIIYDPILNVDINDLEGDDVNVSFYNSASDAMIGWDFVFGGTGTASVTWSGLLSGTGYSWYVKTDDGLCVHQSATWSFTTNYVPGVPTNPTPSDGATDINYNPTLSVDVFDNDGDVLNVSFYNSASDALIGWNFVFGGSGTASVTWSGLSNETSYSWYAKSDDGLNITQSATWSFTTNYVPNAPTNPTPNDGATGINYSPTLSVDVFDNDGDDLTVSFYDASDDSKIDEDSVLGGSGTASVTWSGLSNDTSYSWYAKSDDGLNITQSATWSFTTNYEPGVPTNPTPNDGATGINYNPTLSVDVFDNNGDDLTVSFYDASDDSLIDTELVFGGSGTASVTWTGLLSDTSYSWYAISDDGLSVHQSATWSFTTNYEPGVPTNPTPSDGATDINYNPTLSVDVFDNDGDDLTVSFYDASDDSLIGTELVLGGSGAASVTWTGLSSDTSYSWYAKSDDGLNITQSATWSFTTNCVPNAPTNPVPSDLAYNVDANPTLSVDVSDDDGDTLTVTFYNASDNSVIGSDTVTGGNGTASVTWSGVTSEMICQWYVIANDGKSATQSAMWTFTTYDEVSIPPAIPLPGLIPFGLIVIGTTGILSLITHLRRKKLKMKLY